jgi:hypothetical protein
MVYYRGAMSTIGRGINMIPPVTAIRSRLVMGYDANFKRPAHGVQCQSVVTLNCDK